MTTVGNVLEASGQATDVGGPDAEGEYRALLERLRWPDGVRCPRCDAGRGISRIAARGQFDCDKCHYQFSVRVGTVFYHSPLPLRTWFLALHILTGEPDVTVDRLRRLLDVSYKTAWHLRRRIRVALADETDDLLRTIGQAGHGQHPQLTSRA